MIIFHQNDFIKEKDARLSPLDRGFTLGDGVFDTLLALDGTLIMADAHFARLQDNAAVIGLSFPKTPAQLVTIAQQLLIENDLQTGAYAIRTTLSRGQGARGLLPPDPAIPTLVMMAMPAPAKDKITPPSLITAQTVRRNEHSPLSRIKSTNYGDNILALMEAKKNGADDALLLNTAGNAACVTSGNIFILEDGKFITPPLTDGVLNGTTRSLILEKTAAREQTLTPARLQSAQGLYVTSSILGIRPVTSLDSKKFESDNDDYRSLIKLSGFPQRMG